MGWHPCAKCGELRKVDTVTDGDVWYQPPCSRCGDPGYNEPLDDESE